MAITSRASNSIGGPNGGSTWDSAGGGVPYTIPAVSSVTTLYDVYVTPSVSVNTTSGVVQDSLPSANTIQTLGAIWVVFNAAITLNLAGFSINFSLYRAGAQVGSATFAGWGGTGNTPAFVAHVPVQVPFIITNTTVLAAPQNAALSTTRALASLQPADVIVATIVTPGSFTAIGGIVLDIN